MKTGALLGFADFEFPQCFEPAAVDRGEERFGQAGSRAGPASAEPSSRVDGLFQGTCD